MRALSLYILGLEGLAADGKLQMMLQGARGAHFVSGSNCMGFRARPQEGVRAAMATVKQSYTLQCSSVFRDAVLALAEKRGVNAADVARSVMLVVPPEVIAAYPDPGLPPPDDRETVTLQSGQAAGRVMKRKPRLQLRLPGGLAPELVRKALNLALALDRGTMGLVVRDPAGPVLGGGQEPPPPSPRKVVEKPAAPPPEAAELARLRDDVDRLNNLVSVLSFDPLPEGVQTRGEALHVLGFPPESYPDARELRGRFRLLATVHHPDSSNGSHQRMSQLNAAMDLLRRSSSF